MILKLIRNYEVKGFIKSFDKFKCSEIERNCSKYSRWQLDFMMYAISKVSPKTPYLGKMDPTIPAMQGP